MVLTEQLEILSEGDFYAVNITEPVRAVVKRSGVSEGSAPVFYLHTTGAVMVVEHEAGILADLEDALEKVALTSAEYAHHRRGYDTPMAQPTCERGC